MRTRFILLVGLVILLLAVPAAAQEAGAKYSEKTFQVGEKPYLHVKTVSGNITLVGWEKPGEILVQYRVVGDNVKPLFEQNGDEVFVREDHENSGFFGGSSGSVNFKVFLPWQALVEAKSVSGSVKIDKLGGALEAKTVSGNIQFAMVAAADVTVTSVSGSIDGRFEQPFEGNLQAKSISGDIDLQFAGGANARFRASSISGGIDSKLKLEEMESKKGYGSSSVSGRIGAGAGKVSLSTISGAIEVR
jgi:hypothetical protein